MEFNYKPTLFNLDILVLTKDQLKQMKPVTKLNIFEPSSNNFDPEGLFSTEIFGPVGSKERNYRFSYINLNVPILHPLIYKHITTLRAFYKDVIAGKKYAVYDPKLKDLVPASEEEGDTGYEFFIQTLNKIELIDNNSDMRKFKIYMIAKYGKPDYLLEQFLVLPAGLRDYTVDSSGKPEENEINDYYRKIMTLANSLTNMGVNKDTIKSVDIIRYRIQEAVLELYQYIMKLLDGKRKFIQGKFGSRGILYGTRNVITPSLATITDLEDTNNITIDHTTIGLFQYARGITPITMNKLHTTFLGRIFDPNTASAYLVNPKTLKTELVEVPVKDRETWLTLDGLDDLIGTLIQEELRSQPIMVGKHYLLNLYDDGKIIEPIFNTEQLPDDYNPKYLRPITYYEMLYIALVDTFDKYRGFLTRYPVINIGGIYPSKIYVKTTSNPRHVTIKLGIREIQTKEYPNFKEPYYNSLSPHYAFLAALGADFDGDKCSFNIVYTKESVEEIDKLLNSKEFYISPDNRLVFSPETGTLKYVIAAMNKGVIYA